MSQFNKKLKRKAQKKLIELIQTSNDSLTETLNVFNAYDAADIIDIFKRKISFLSQDEQSVAQGLEMLKWIRVNATNHQGLWVKSCHDMLFAKGDLIKEKNVHYLELCANFNAPKLPAEFVQALKDWPQGWKVFTQKVFDKLPITAQEEYIKFSIIYLSDKSELSFFPQERQEALVKLHGIGWLKNNNLSDHEVLSALHYMQGLNFSLTAKQVAKLISDKWPQTSQYLFDCLAAEHRGDVLDALRKDHKNNTANYFEYLMLHSTLNAPGEKTKKPKL